MGFEVPFFFSISPSVSHLSQIAYNPSLCLSSISVAPARLSSSPSSRCPPFAAAVISRAACPVYPASAVHGERRCCPLFASSFSLSTVTHRHLPSSARSLSAANAATQQELPLFVVVRSPSVSICRRCRLLRAAAGIAIAVRPVAPLHRSRGQPLLLALSATAGEAQEATSPLPESRWLPVAIRSKKFLLRRSLPLIRRCLLGVSSARCC